MNAAPNLIVIAAGGTGGHMFPALALAQTLRERGRLVALITDVRTAERARALFAPGEVYVLPSAGLAGRGVLRGILALGTLARGTLAARRIFRAAPPLAVVGFGGYPSVPPVLAARFLDHRPPLIMLHEQNAVLGRANRMLSRFADLLALSFANTSRIPPFTKTAVTGNPVRGEIAAKAGTPYLPPEFGPIRLLVLGGSLGARVFNDVVPAALGRLPEDLRSRLVVIQQARAEDVGNVREAYRTARIEAQVEPFFHDVAGLLTDAHLVISRSGASSVAELAIIGRPSILVPLPAAIDDHQTANCKALVERQGAIWMPQPMLNVSLLTTLLDEFLTAPAKLASMAAAARDFAHPNAARDLADLIDAHLSRRIAA